MECLGYLRLTSIRCYGLATYYYECYHECQQTGAMEAEDALPASQLIDISAASEDG